MNALYDNDASPANLRDKTIAIVGYGRTRRPNATACAPRASSARFNPPTSS